MWCPGPDSNRQAVKRRIFITLNLSKPAIRRLPFVRWTMPSPLHATRAFRAASGRRPPSSLYTFQKRPLRPVSGLARRCLGCKGSRERFASAWGARGFTEFEGFCTGRFRLGHSIFLSPLCLPISSPGQGGRDSTIAPRMHQLRPRYPRKDASAKTYRLAILRTQTQRPLLPRRFDPRRNIPP